MANYTIINVYILRIEIFEEIDWGNGMDPLYF